MAKSPKDYGVPWGDKTEVICQATGYFLHMYALNELIITALLAKALGYDNDYEKFELVTGGLDARGKIHRLLQAGDAYSLPVGPNLRLLLDDFIERDVNLRNIMAHTWAINDEKKEDVIHFTTMGKTVNPLDRPLPGKPRNLKPPSRSLKEIYDRVAWLHKLYLELVQIARMNRSSLSVLEVDPAKLMLPQAPLKGLKPNPHTIPDRHTRKAHRKAQRRSLSKK